MYRASAMTALHPRKSSSWSGSRTIVGVMEGMDVNVGCSEGIGDGCSVGIGDGCTGDRTHASSS